MQEDLDTIYEWVIKFWMLFNEDKFKQMTFRHTNKSI